MIGSGVATNIKDICKYIFEKVDLNFEDFIDINPKSMRSGEPIHVQSNPKKLKIQLVGKQNEAFLMS